MKKFFIKKGNHSSGFHFRPYFGKRIILRKFRIDKSCLFPLVNPDDFDINKLFGISYLSFKKFPPHHYNSIRVGWIPSKNEQGRMDITFYMYNNGKRMMIRFFTIDVDKDYTMTIDTTARNNSVIFNLNDDSGKLLYSLGVPYQYPKFRWGYWLWFYAGGNNPAPHDMWMWLSKN